MAEDAIDWSEFHRHTLSRPPRELLRRTLGCFELEQRPPGVAVDLGCGSGADSAELLRRGWTVHAVDAAAPGLELLRAQVPAATQDRLRLHAQRFEAFDFPRCDLVWAGYSLPFCAAAEWPAFWRRALAALRPGGRIAGDLFGPRHAFAADGVVMVLDEAQARACFDGLVLEAFDVEDGVRPSGGRITRWHAFGFAARAGDAAAAAPGGPA